MTDDADSEDAHAASEIGEANAPPVEEAPYKIIFEANKCFGAGKCAEKSTNWTLSIDTGLGTPQAYFFGEEDLEENLEAARACPARNGKGVIRIIDRETGEEIY